MNPLFSAFSVTPVTLVTPVASRRMRAVHSLLAATVTATAMVGGGCSKLVGVEIAATSAGICEVSREMNGCHWKKCGAKTANATIKKASAAATVISREYLFIKRRLYRWFQAPRP